jgi:AhpD family alkylhydroperoxidase
MQSRMRSPAMVVPGALQALLAVGKCAEKGGVATSTHALVHLRASQINGCGFCVDMHARELKKLGESDERIFGVAAWHESPYFTEAERAALALTECATRLADRADPVPDDVWNEATKHYDEAAIGSLILSIATVNLWNRLNAATRQIAGPRHG